MEYFHMGIFVIPGVCLIRKYGSQSKAFFFCNLVLLGYSVLICSSVPYVFVKKVNFRKVNISSFLFSLPEKLCVLLVPLDGVDRSGLFSRVGPRIIAMEVTGGSQDEGVGHVDVVDLQFSRIFWNKNNKKIVKRTKISISGPYT